MEEIREIWKEVKNYEGLYEVSNLGRVRSVNRIVNAMFENEADNQVRTYFGRMIKPHYISKAGYPAVNLSKNGKFTKITVHKLVAQAFLGDCPEGLEICHNDSNVKNSCVENLRYDTHESNMRDTIIAGTNPTYKLNVENVKEIRKLIVSNKYSFTEIAGMYNVSIPTISKIYHDRIWKNI